MRGVVSTEGPRRGVLQKVARGSAARSEDVVLRGGPERRSREEGLERSQEVQREVVLTGGRAEVLQRGPERSEMRLRQGVFRFGKNLWAAYCASAQRP